MVLKKAEKNQDFSTDKGNAMNGKLEIKTMQVEELLKSKAKYNPRAISPKARSGLIASIKRFGYIDPIIYNTRTKTIVSGHQRLDILCEEGYSEVDVSIVDVSLEVEKELNVTLNNNLITGEYTDNISELIEEFSIDFIDSTFIDELDIFSDKEDDPTNNPKDTQPYPKMDLLPYESYDCILIITETKNDFNFLKEKFGLKKVNSSTAYSGKSKIGETRAVKGSDVIKLLTKDSNEFEL